MGEMGVGQQRSHAVGVYMLQRAKGCFCKLAIELEGAVHIRTRD